MGRQRCQWEDMNISGFGFSAIVTGRDVCWQEIYERLEELDPATFETTAAKLLHGLGCASAHAVLMPCTVLCLCTA